MSWIPAVVSGAATIFGAMNRPKKGEPISSINSRYRDENVAGWLSPEDRAQMERTRAGGVHAAERGADLTRGSIYRQVASRGLSGASAAALTMSADQQAAEGRDAASARADAVGDQLYAGNQQYGREKQMTAWGNDVGESQRQTAQANTQDATFWNSALEAIPGVMSMWGGGRSTAPAASPSAAQPAPPPTSYGAYNPSVVSPRSDRPF